MKKKILMIATLLLALPLVAIAQQTAGSETPSRDTVQWPSLIAPADRARRIPVSRQQAETLVAKLIAAALAADSIDRQHQLDELVMRTKIEALKRKLVDEALARSYNAGLEQRLDRLERLIMLQLVNNTNLTPDVLQTILAPQAATTPPVAQPTARPEPDTRTTPAANVKTATPGRKQKR